MISGNFFIKKDYLPLAMPFILFPLSIVNARIIFLPSIPLFYSNFPITNVYCSVGHLYCSFAMALIICELTFVNKFIRNNLNSKTLFTSSLVIYFPTSNVKSSIEMPDYCIFAIKNKENTVFELFNT